jgi:magnesium-transporting ATPase (P-type)
MTSSTFIYNKAKVIQALRYHFITRKEIRIMMILVNVFAILSAVLFYSKKVSPLAFLISTVLWIALMVTFWYVLPLIIYKQSGTFKDSFKVNFTEADFVLENERGRKTWPWNSFSTLMESPHFFHLYFNSRSFFIIPKDAFKDDELKTARQLIKMGIKKR